MSNQSQSTSEPRNPLWYPDRALKRMGGDEGLLVNLIGYFHEDAPDLLKKLSAAIDQSDAEEATRFAHSLKGLCANYEAKVAVQRAQEVEDCCREGAMAAAKGQLDDLRQRVDELGVALKTWQSKRT